VDTVAPFHAWRYAPKAGEPAALVAPPYDVIGPDLQSRLYARSRYNVVRVDLGMALPSDNECENRYSRAAAQLTEWKNSGVLTRDPVPTVTFVEEEFTGPDGRPRVRHGFLAALRLHEFSEGVVYPHEQTFSGPKEDRFLLMDATAMSLSPVFMLYDLPGDEITSAWSAGPGAGAPATSVTDDDGTVTRLWPTSDPALLGIVTRALADGRFIIADGHHRYETALRYRDYRHAGAAASAAGRVGGPGVLPAYEYVLVYLSNMADPGLAIYATHRLIRGMDPQRLAALRSALSGGFVVDDLGAIDRAKADAHVAKDAVRPSIEGYLADHPRGAFGVWVPDAGQVYGIRLRDPGAAAAAVPGHSRAYIDLDVTILQRLVFEQTLEIPAEGPATEQHLSFFKDADDAFERLALGEFQAGFFMNPTRLEQVREVALGGERMPQKATFFYPKLPTGLEFLDLSGLL
jgi:uncharacterized protein (DUF1015 family)